MDTFLNWGFKAVFRGLDYSGHLNGGFNAKKLLIETSTNFRDP